MEVSDASSSSNDSLEKKMVNIKLNRPIVDRKRNASSLEQVGSKKSKITWP